MTKSIIFAAAVCAILVPPLPVSAQQDGRVYRVGILSNAPKANKAIAERLAQFRDELRQLGYVSGRNVRFLDRHPSSMTGRAADTAALAKELAGLNPDVIFTFSSPATDSVQMATHTIPVVVGVSVDRFVRNFGRPDGNITGLSSQQKEVVGKQLQIFRETLPELKKIALLWDPGHGAHPPVVNEARRAAKALGLTMLAVAAGNPAVFEPAFRKMKQADVDGVLVLRGGLFVNSRPKLSDLANRLGIPSMFGHPSEARAGGLMSYGTNVEALFRRAAHYVDKILKGARPQNLPVEGPTQFDLVINKKTAGTLGISIPPAILLRANEVIE